MTKTPEMDRLAAVQELLAVAGDVGRQAASLCVGVPADQSTGALAGVMVLGELLRNIGSVSFALANWANDEDGQAMLLIGALRGTLMQYRRIPLPTMPGVPSSEEWLKSNHVDIDRLAAALDALAATRLAR